MNTETKKVCACGAELPPPADNGRERKHCSRACKNRAADRMRKERNRAALGRARPVVEKQVRKFVRPTPPRPDRFVIAIVVPAHLVDRLEAARGALSLPDFAQEIVCRHAEQLGGP